VAAFLHSPPPAPAPLTRQGGGGTALSRTPPPGRGPRDRSAIPRPPERRTATDTDARRDQARFTQDGWTFHLAYPSGLCARLTPTGLDGQLVDQALRVVIQQPGWDDLDTAMELAQRALKTAGLR